MTIHKILKYLALAIGVIGLILWGRVLWTGDDAIESSASVQASVVTPFLIVAYVIFAIIVLLVLFFVIKGLFSGNIKRTLIAVGAFLLVIVIAYLLSGGTEVTMNDGEVISANTVHWVSAGLITFYILAATAVLLMVFSGIQKLIK
ncbi:hypothetical protein [Salinimicrobium flavum]|uniref:Uncharacterized protein n=1 Tax=Salinimicrobium flavum TaxID=1737065 RepID=A0ABW5IVD4_9FLAO